MVQRVGGVEGHAHQRSGARTSAWSAQRYPGEVDSVCTQPRCWCVVSTDANLDIDLDVVQEP